MAKKTIYRVKILLEDVEILGELDQKQIDIVNWLARYSDKIQIFVLGEL